MIEFLDDFVPCLLDILRDQAVAKEMKIPALHAMGDLAMYCSSHFCQNYLQWTMQILDQASMLATNIQELKGDQDMLQFLSELREEVIEVYITVLMAASDSNSLPVFAQFTNQIFDFLERTF